MKTQPYSNKVGFAVGTGRCGTKFLSKILQLEPDVSSVHERNPLNETFHRYSKWYNLPIDHEGFLNAKAREINKDLLGHSYSFEASAHLSLSVEELYKYFDAKIVLLVRSPELVVNSYLKKGWYTSDFIRADSNLAPGYQNSTHFHHFLGRIVPSGKEFKTWKNFTRVGKLAWYWNHLNKKVIELLQAIPETHWRIAKLEKLSYENYGALCEFLGFSPTISKHTYNAITLERPNAIPQVPTIASWSPHEIEEFEFQVAPMAARLEYPCKVSELQVYRPKMPTMKNKFKTKYKEAKKFLKKSIV